MSKPFPIEVIKFPVLCFNQNLILIEESESSLTTCNIGALKNGWFKEMKIIDSELQCFVVISSRKLHGVGHFWGYNIFLNQRIKVELAVNEQPEKVTLENIKERIFQSLKKSLGWSSRDDFEKLKTKVREAASFPEIVQLLRC